MTERKVTTKNELLAENARSWKALNAALERLSEDQMTTLTDAQGWTVKDHLAHLAAWENSVIFFLQHQPRHLGLGVDESTYQDAGFNAINHAIYQHHQALSLAEALALLRSTHQQFLDLLQPLTDADLNRHYRDYLPEEPGEGQGPRVIDLLDGNSANHFMEHLEWIKALVK